MTGPELKKLREDNGAAIGIPLPADDFAKLCGLPPGNGADTIRRWKVTGLRGPVAELLGVLAMPAIVTPSWKILTSSSGSTSRKSKTRAPRSLSEQDAR
jgi:hypothetical protein